MNKLFKMLLFHLAIVITGCTQLKGIYTYTTESVGGTKIEFKNKRKFDYNILFSDNILSGNGYYRKLGRRYTLHFSGSSECIVSSSGYFISEQFPSDDDSVSLSFTVYDNVFFEPFRGAMITIFQERDNILCQGITNFNGIFECKLAKNTGSLDLSITNLNNFHYDELFIEDRNTNFNVHFSNLIFEETISGCFIYKEDRKLDLKIKKRKTEKDVIFIRYPDSKKRYRKFKDSDDKSFVCFKENKCSLNENIRIRTKPQVLVQFVYRIHIGSGQFEIPDIKILFDALRIDTFRNGHYTVLNVPA